MFRRKEDSLFDNTTDPNQEPTESGTSTSSGSSAPSSPSQTSGSSYQNANNSPASSGAPTSGANTSGYGQSTPRPPSAAQPSSSSPSTAFRPNAAAPLSTDMGRNRMPEANTKPQQPTTPSSGPIPAPSSMPASSDNKAGNAAKKSSGHRVLTVGNDILLKGEIATCDRLVIEGKVDATLNDVHTVEIAEHGSFKGSASIENAEISGLFEGDLVVRNRLVIYATGKVRGNITYGEIEIERGGELTGEIKTNVGESASTSSRQRHKNKEAA